MSYIYIYMRKYKKGKNISIYIYITYYNILYHVTNNGYLMILVDIYASLRANDIHYTTHMPRGLPIVTGGTHGFSNAWKMNGPCLNTKTERPDWQSGRNS